MSVPLQRLSPRRRDVRRAKPVDGDGSAAPISLPLVEHRVTPMTSDGLLAWMSATLPSRGKFLVAGHNLHSLYLMEESKDFANFYSRADVVLIDGYPVLKLAQFARPGCYRSGHRVGSLDWVPRVGVETAVRRVAVVGGSHCANTRAVDRLTRSGEDVDVRGWPGENWCDRSAEHTVSALHVFSPDLVLVGLGMPLQEKFLLNHWNRLPDGIYAAVGGAIDQLAGLQKPAPRWLGRFGVEWVWRLMTQPRRLAKRYLVEPWLLIVPLCRKKLSWR